MGIPEEVRFFENVRRAFRMRDHFDTRIVFAVVTQFFASKPLVHLAGTLPVNNFDIRL